MSLQLGQGVDGHLAGGAVEVLLALLPLLLALGGRADAATRLGRLRGRGGDAGGIRSALGELGGRRGAQRRGAAR